MYCYNYIKVVKHNSFCNFCLNILYILLKIGKIIVNTFCRVTECYSFYNQIKFYYYEKFNSNIVGIGCNGGLQQKRKHVNR